MGSRFSGQPAPAASRPDEDEAALVARNHALEPVRARRRADEDEARVDLQQRLGTVRPADAQALEVTASPSAATAELPVRTSTFGRAAICSIR